MKNMLFDRKALCIERRWNTIYDEVLDAPIKEFSDALTKLMYEFVKKWWGDLDENVQNAIRTLKFSRTLITGQMFFSDVEETSDYGNFMCGYDDFNRVMLTYVMDLAHDEARREEVTKSYGNFYNRARDILRFEEVWECVRKDAESLTSRIHSETLRNEVLADILKHDKCLSNLDKEFSEWMSSTRRKYLEVALDHLEKEMRG